MLLVIPFCFEVGDRNKESVFTQSPALERRRILEIPACAGKTAYFGDSSLRWKDGEFWRFQPALERRRVLEIPACAGKTACFGDSSLPTPTAQKAIGDPGRWNDDVGTKTFRPLDP